MKLTRELLAPYLAEGHPEDIADDPKFLDVLKNVTVVEGCTEEKWAIDYLKMFFKKGNLVNILIKISRFDILINKNLEGDLLSNGRYLDEIYQAIQTSVHKEFQPHFLARFCEHGQRDYLVGKNAWDGIAKSKIEPEFLIEQDKAHFLVYHSMFKLIKIEYGYTHCVNTEILDMVYKGRGVSPFRIAYEMSRSSGAMGIYNTILDFMFEKEEFDFVFERTNLYERVEKSLISGSDKMAEAIFFYQFYLNKKSKAAEKIKGRFSMFGKVYWQLGKKKWKDKTLAEIKEELSK